MATASKTRTRRSSQYRSGSDNAAGSGKAGAELGTDRKSSIGPRPMTVIGAAKPAAKRHTRRVAGETPVPLPARKKYPKVRTVMARPAKRMPSVATTANPAGDTQSFGDNQHCNVWLDDPVGSPRVWPARLWHELFCRLRAHVRRLQPRRVLLDQATARYLQLLAERPATRPSA